MLNEFVDVDASDLKGHPSFTVEKGHTKYMLWITDKGLILTENHSQTRMSEFLWSKIKSWHGDLSRDLFHFEYDYSGDDEPSRTETITFTVHKNLKDLELSMLHEIAKLIRQRHPHAEKQGASDGTTSHSGGHSHSSVNHPPASHDGYQRLDDN
eukprot:TRINITY_DN7114_c0_g1_i1.p1 TRINITY_DN7114_c0_g1~~TRINITY_DN7114_c0_g1_i1.p1  ORF type:complete len:154 (+),score=20.20 TRINITY_DN7114_c0_g1_i1:60-521(+)